MENNMWMISCVMLLNCFVFRVCVGSEYIDNINLNERKTVIVTTQKVLRGSFTGEEWKSWSDKLTIESKFTSNSANNQVNLAVFYNEHSESWILTNHSITTLCVSQISSLIIVASNPTPETQVEIEIYIYPKSILLSIDKKESRVEHVSISTPLTFVVDNKADTSQPRNLLLTVDDEDIETNKNDLVCMIVGVYDGQCPLKDREDDIFTADMWTTALSRATITINTYNLKFEGPFYITILVAKQNSLCHRDGGTPYHNRETVTTRRNQTYTLDSTPQTVQDNTGNEVSNKVLDSSHLQAKRVKVNIVTASTYSSYILPIVIQIVAMCVFIIVALVIMVKRKLEDDGMCPKNSIELTERKDEETSKMNEEGEAEVAENDDNVLDENELNVISGKSVQDDNIENKDVEGNTDSVYEDCADHDVVDGIGDVLIEKIKSVMVTPSIMRRDKKRSKQRKDRISSGLSRLKEHPTLADMTKIVDKNVWFRRNRSRVYFYIVPLLSLYYFVPAIQFAFLAKQNEISTGSQDLCYHNFRCSKPFYIFSDFNHVISNLAYVLFGLAFMVLVKIKERKLPDHCFDYSIKTGILRQLSIFYAMGFSLMAQGFFSVCYHVCPTNLSLQFDTTMMYILCTLCFVKIYQFRHPDATANAYSIFMLLGALVLLEALTLYSSSWWIFAVFLAFYLSMTIFISFDVYYNGVGRLDRSITRLLAKDIMFNWTQIYRGTYRGNESSQSKSKRNYLSRIRFPARFKFSLCFCLINFCYASYCVFEKLKKPDKSVSHVVLFILGGNMVLYLAYYIWNSRLKACQNRTRSYEDKDGMTVERTDRDESCSCNVPCCKQFIHAGSFFAISAFFLFAIGLIFYIKRSANRNLSPAESKNLNAECTFLDFFDNHDLWHFFGAAGIFMAFCSLLTADDDLLNVDRKKIPVF